MRAYFQLLHPQAQIPTRGSEDAAGFDLKSVEEGYIEPGQTKIIGTGLRLMMQDEEAHPGEVLVAKVMSRSGLAAKFGVHILNAPGIIDQDYRGEIKFILHNTSSKPYHYYVGDRLGQLIFERVLVPSMAIVDEIRTDDTERGAGGLGSTGVSVRVKE